MEITNEIHSIITINYGMFLDSSYYFRDMAELELETQQVVEESIACDYGKQFICPNCSEPFDGHECENCKYTEGR